MAMFDNDWFEKGSGADAWLNRQRTYHQKKKEEEESIAAELAAETSGSKKDVPKLDENGKPVPEDKRPWYEKTAGAVGGFVKDAAIDIKDTTVGAVTGIKDTYQGWRATEQLKKNTDAVMKNSKEWSAFMATLPEGDEAAWNDPATREKLKEFKYKNKLLTGQNIDPSDIPANAAIKDTPDQFALDPKTGKMGLIKGSKNPYADYKPLDDRSKRDMEELQKINAGKLAAQSAETFLNVATLGVGTGLKAGAKAGIKQGIKAGLKATAKATLKAGAEEVVGKGGKALAKKALMDATIGGAYGVTTTIRNAEEAGVDFRELGLDDYSKNILLGASIGAAAPVVFKGVGHLARKTDSTAGKFVAETGEKLLNKKTGAEVAAAENAAMRASLKQIGEDGIVGSLNKFLNRSGQRVAYAVGDAAEKTKVGRAAINLKDDFMQKMVTNFHPLYKVLKRADFEGETDGAYMAMRESIGNANRALSYADDFLEHNPNSQQLTGSLAARGTDYLKTRELFDEFAKLRSESDLVAAGKKVYGQGKMADIEKRMAALGDNKFDEEYGMLVNMYKDLNKFRLENGTLSKELYDAYEKEGFDYVRIQRELPDWLIDKPKGAGGMGTGGSAVSITKSGLDQKLNKYANAEELSPLETLIRSTQLAHVEVYRNKAAKTMYDLLDQAGEANLVRSTDIVRAKQALIKELGETKPIVTRMQKVVRSNAKAVRSLQTEMSRLSKEGLDITLKRGEKDSLPEAFRYVNVDEIRNPVTIKGKKTQPLVRDDPLTGTIQTRLSTTKGANPRKMIEALITEDPARLKQIRRMIGTRDEKLNSLMDTLELENGKLHEMYAKREGLWQSAQGMKTAVDKKGMTSISFLDDGVENVVKIDPDIAAGVHNWDRQAQNILIETVRRANQVFKYGTTGANVAFALPNFVADWTGSAINSKNLMATHGPRNFVHTAFMAVGKPLNAEDAEMLRGFLAGNNAKTTMVNQYTRTASADKAASNFAGKGATKAAKMYTTLKHPKQAMRTLFDAMEAGVSATEQFTRMANYRGTAKVAVKEGMDTVTAGKLGNVAARENSVDFLEAGDWGRLINNFLPYFNAGIQGSRVMLRNAGERPASFMAKTTALVGVPVLASTAWNNATEERKAIYDTIPEYVKETNFVLVGPNAKWDDEKRKWEGVYIMKKPPGFKEFTEPVRKFVEWKADDPDADMAEFFREEGGSIASDFGASFAGTMDFSSPEKFLSSVTPQAMKPTAEAILNRNFFQERDIVPENMIEGGTEAKDQKYEQYSQLTAALGGMFDVSPLKIDHWIRGTFGEVGTNAQNLADRALTDDPNAVGGRSISEGIERRFIGAPGGADADAFWDTFNPAMAARKRTSAQVTTLVKQGRIQEAKRKAEDYNAGIKDRMRKFYEDFGNSPNFDPEWNDRVDSLEIKTTESSFSARRRQK